MDEHYKAVHPVWASWLPWRKRLPIFIKASVIILLLLVVVAILTRDILLPLIFVAIFFAILGLFLRVDIVRMGQAQYQSAQ